MSILDDAIREHLELKRAHGADDSELKRLEDEAFGPPQRPDEADPFAEAPTEFLLSPTESAADLPEVADEASRSGRRPDIADLQEPPAGPPRRRRPCPRTPCRLSRRTSCPRRPTRRRRARPTPPTCRRRRPTRRSGTRSPTSRPRCSTCRRRWRHRPTPPRLPPSRRARATTSWSTPPRPSPRPRRRPPRIPPPARRPSSTSSRRSRPAVPTPRSPATRRRAEPEAESAEYDFFNEQRLSDELDQALEAPLPPTDEHALPTYGDAAPAEGGIFDFESDRETYEEDPSEEVLRKAPAPEPPSEEIEPPSEETPRGAAEPPSEEADHAFDPDTGHEDVLEDTPDFLEDAPEDDDLWFEQKPPKDFDLD